MKCIIIVIASLLLMGCVRLRVWETKDLIIAEQTGKHWMIDLPRYVVKDKETNETFGFNRCMFGGRISAVDSRFQLYLDDKYIYILSPDPEWEYSGRYEIKEFEISQPPLDRKYLLMYLKDRSN